MKGARYKLEEVVPNVFLVTFDKAYDVAMTFCRVQEYQESPKYYHKLFKMDDYMRDYAVSKKNIFTYPMDWRGFNLPGHTIDHVIERLNTTNYDYKTGYDLLFQEIVGKIKRKVGKHSYYLIGVSQERDIDDVIPHEVAHGLYTTNPTYRAEVDKLIKALKPSVRNKIYNHLRDIEYHKSVWPDELNAYMSTGLRKGMINKQVKAARKPFIALYKSTRKCSK